MKNKNRFAAIILAAGLGKRMNSQFPKVLHKAAGKPLFYWGTKLAMSVVDGPIALVLGHGKELVEKSVVENFGEKAKRITIAYQEKQLGTADAVRAGLEAIPGFNEGYTLIMVGDAPLLTEATIKATLELARKKEPEIVMLTAIVSDPSGYGRVLREAEDDGEQIAAIIEDKDAKGPIKNIAEIISGIYLVKTPFLREVVNKIENSNAQKEFYLTDMVEIARKAGRCVAAYISADPREILGVNDRSELSDADFIMRMRINKEYMKNGATLIDPATAYIDPDAAIERDVTIYPNVEIRGRCEIKSGAVIQTGAYIEASKIGADALIKPYCVIEESDVGEKAQVGPFAHLRPASVMLKKSKVGNFVEMKKTTLGEGRRQTTLLIWATPKSDRT